MNSAPLLIIGIHCRLCHALISQSEIAEYRKLYNSPYGDEENGYVCLRCHNTGAEKFVKMQTGLTEFFTSVTEIDGVVSPPCAMCGTIEGEWRRGPVMIDGEDGFICLDCEPTWQRQQMRDIVRGTKLEFDLKLK